MYSNNIKSSGSCRISRGKNHLFKYVDTDLLHSPKSKDNPLIKKPITSPQQSPKPITSPQQSPKSIPSDNVRDIKDGNTEIIEILKNRVSSYDFCDEILEKIDKRLDFGKKKYGHGIIIEDDTTKYSNNWDKCSAQNWLMMGYEEMLDGCVYLSAELLRAQKHKLPSKYIIKIEKSLKYCIKSADMLLNAEESRNIVP